MLTTQNTAENKRTEGKIAHTLKMYLCKMRCHEKCRKQHVKWGEVFLSSLGSFLGISPIALISIHYGVPLLIPSFGASAALLYATCNTPMAQPRNVLGGHILSSLVGVTVYKLFGNGWWAMTLAIIIAISLMLITNTMHPPGGATAFIAVLNGQDFSFIIAPVALGSVLLIIVAVLFNNLISTRKYPQYWL